MIEVYTLSDFSFNIKSSEIQTHNILYLVQYNKNDDEMEYILNFNLDRKSKIFIRVNVYLAIILKLLH